MTITSYIPSLLCFSKLSSKISSPHFPNPHSDADAAAAGDTGMKHCCMMKSLVFRSLILHYLLPDEVFLDRSPWV
ncbi:hypothetical protein OIU84_026540 [Salix udensis]|uniref:Uncharacterized protein n=1 Tax=Salix udensis TaxID=889485 RepID=A0AAD6KPB2_9ROSI|nr:hypothetical protein OIU84_026540 [Salix udensis]